ncbi:hypothetical protein QBC40DRAFT_314807, partial [Triangularia verruculosa]
CSPDFFGLNRGFPFGRAGCQSSPPPLSSKARLGSFPPTVPSPKPGARTEAWMNTRTKGLMVCPTFHLCSFASRSLPSPCRGPRLRWRSEERCPSVPGRPPLAFPPTASSSFSISTSRHTARPSPSIKICVPVQGPQTTSRVGADYRQHHRQFPRVWCRCLGEEKKDGIGILNSIHPPSRPPPTATRPPSTRRAPTRTATTPLSGASSSHEISFSSRTSLIDTASPSTDTHAQQNTHLLRLARQLRELRPPTAWPRGSFRAPIHIHVDVLSRTSGKSFSYARIIIALSLHVHFCFRHSVQSALRHTTRLLPPCHHPAHTAPRHSV